MNSHIHVSFKGERALFKSSNVEVIDCVFDEGESPLKESNNLVIEKSTFSWKYPLWYCHTVQCNNTTFNEMARAGIWYTRNARFTDCIYHAPKLFRKCRDIEIYGGDFHNGSETFWWCDGMLVENVSLKGDYVFMKSKNLSVKNFNLVGNYSFDGCEDVVIRDSVLKTKDAFWNSKNIECYNCVIEGEYFGWNSENVYLEDCTIISHQGFCYMKNVKLVNCKIINTDLCFEYCEDIDATILTHVDSIKNPISGTIRCPSVGELILDDPNIDHSRTNIIYG